MAEEKFEAIVGAGIEEFKRKMREVNDIMTILATGVTVDMDVNSAHVMSEIARVDRKLDQLDGRDIDIRVNLNTPNLSNINLNGSSINIDVDSSEVIRKLEQVQQKMREIARDRVNVIVELDLVRFLAEMRVLEAHLAQLRTTRVEIDVTADLTRFNRQSQLLQARINALNGQSIRIPAAQIGGLGGASGGGGGSLGLSALLTLLPAVVPLAAAATNAIGAIGVALGVVAGQTVALAVALGVAVAGYAAIAAMAIPTIKYIFDGEAKLTAQQKKAKQSFKDLAKAYDELVVATEQPILITFTKAMQTAEKVLKKLEPMFMSVAKEAETLSASLSKSIDSEGMQKFFSFLNEDGANIMGDITRGLGNFLNGVLSLLAGFRPLANSVSDGFLSMSQSFSTWADSVTKSQSFYDFMNYVSTNMPKISSILGNTILGIINLFAAFGSNTSSMLSSLQAMTSRFREWSSILSENQGFQEFLDYAQKSGGQVIRLIGEIVKLIINFAVALAPVGSVVMTVITAITGFVNKIMESSKVLAFLIAVIPTVIGALTLLAAPVLMVIGLFGQAAVVSAFTAVLSALISPIALVIYGITALATGIAIAYEKFEPFREVLNTIGTFLVSTFNSALQVASETLSLFGQALQAAFNGDFSGIINFFTVIIPTMVSNILAQLPLLLQTGAQILTNLLNGFVQNLPMIVSTITTFIQNFVTTITTQLPKFLQTGVEILTNVLNGIIQALPQIIAVAVQVITMLIQAWAENYPKILQAGIELLLALVEGILGALPDLISAVLEIILTLVETILTSLPDILDAGIEILLTLVEGITSMLPDLIDAAIKIIETLVEMISDNLPQIIDMGIETLLALVEGILEALPELITAVLELITAIVEAIIDALPQIIEAGIEIVIALVEGLITALPDIVDAALELIDGIVSTLLDAVPDLVSAGADLVAGIVDGILSGASSLLSAVGSLADKAVAWFEKKLQIKSPSRVFAASSKWIPEGISKGIEGNEQTVLKSIEGLTTSMTAKYQKGLKKFADASDISNNEKLQINKITNNTKLKLAEQLSALEKFASKQTELNRMTAMEEAKYWKYAANAFKDGTAEKIKALNKYQDTLSKGLAQQYDREQKYVNAVVEKGYWGYARQIEAYEKYMASYKKGSEQQVAYQKLIYDTKEKYYNDLSALAQDYLNQEQAIFDKLTSGIQSLKDKYDSMYKSRVDSLTGFAGLFDSFTGNDVSELDMIGNMQQQVNALEEYQSKMNSLMKRGLSKALIDELRELGVASVNEISKLASMSTEELAKFQELFNQKQSLAESIATKELSVERRGIMNEMQKLKNEANRELASLKKSFATNLDEMLNGSTKKFKLLQGSMADIGANVINGLIKGISSKRSALSNELQSISNLMKSKLKTELDIHSPSRWAYDEVGLNYMYGITNALRDAQPLLDAQLNDVAATMKLNDSNFTTSEQISANIRSSEHLEFDGWEEDAKQPIILHVHNDWNGEDILTYIDEENGKNYDIKLYTKGG